MSSSQPTVAISSSKFRGWAFGPALDSAFVLFSPVAILALFQLAERGDWTEALVAFALASAMGHYLPGILRAYGDASLFRRFRTRLVVAPVLLYGLTTLFAWFNFGFVFLVVGVWGAWHWTMQIYGFARIYDAKSSSGAAPPLLDKMLCVMWFGMCTFVLNDVFQVYVRQFYESGGRRLASSAFRQFSSAWLALTVLLTAAYLIQVFVQFRRGARPNPLKFLFIALTFVYLRFTASQIDNPAIGYAMFEMWHDVQYLFIVWSFNVGRVRANPEAGRFLRFLFRPRFGLVVLYVGACLAFGSLTHAWHLFSEPTFIRVAAAIVPATAMLHYYLDGFIWRIREPETRAALGVATRISNRPERRLLPLRISPAMRHAMLWLVLIVPSSVLFALEYKNADRRPIPVIVYEKLVDTFPDSPRAQYELGRELQEAGRLEEGKVHLERSVALAPRSHRTLTHLGVLLADQGNAESAKGYFERALEIRPSDVETRNNLAIVLEDLGNLQQARAQLLEATRLDPDYALAHSNLGIVLGKLGDADAGIREMEQALRLDPQDAAIHNNLGEVLVKVNRKADAKTHFAEALRLQPDFRQARQNFEALDVPLE